MIAEPRSMPHAVTSATLADVLERVLDKGVVIAGDIKIQIADIDLITIKIRLLISSVDKAKEMGIDWWEHDSYLASKAQAAKLEEENRRLREQLAGVEANPSTETAAPTPSEFARKLSAQTPEAKALQPGGSGDPAAGPPGGGPLPQEDELATLKARIAKLEARPVGARIPPPSRKKDA